ncbi:MAG: hypothetical protein ABSA97_13125 [Verrucomicrobiia bacterium]
MTALTMGAKVYLSIVFVFSLFSSAARAGDQPYIAVIAKIDRAVETPKGSGPDPAIPLERR